MPHIVISEGLDDGDATDASALVPLSIAYAVIHYHNHHLQQNAASKEDPIDIAAVVLSTDINFQSQTTTLLMGDPSLPPNTCAKVFLHGSVMLSWIVSSQIKRGDLLRLNRLELKKGYCHDIFNTSEQREKSYKSIKQQQLPTIICEFRPSWKIPEAGNVMIKLNAGHDPHQSCIHGVLTPSEWISVLQDWFQREFLNSNFSSALSSTTPISACQKRKLSTITEPHLISDVVVQVVSLHNEPHRGLTRKFPFRYKSSNHTSNLQTYAIISDGPNEENVMALHQCKKFFRPLKQAMDTNSYILITNLISTDSSCTSTLDGNVHGVSIILIPTNESIVKILTEKDNDLHRNKKMHYIHNKFKRKALEDSALEEVTDFLSFSLTQTQPCMGNSQNHIQPRKKTIQCRVVDIFWEDIGNRLSYEDSKISPSKLIQHLIRTSPDFEMMNCNESSQSIEGSRTGKCIQQTRCNKNKPKYEYRDATLTLAEASKNPSAILLKVHARSNIMCMLCASIPANNFEVLLTTQLNSSTEKNKNGLQNLVFDLLQGMIAEKIVFEWTLQHRQHHDDVWDVLDVSLLTLPSI